MKIAIVKETRSGERRVAASPDTVKKFVEMGLDVRIQLGAGKMSAFSDNEYERAGALITHDLKTTLESADIILKVQRPNLNNEQDREHELQYYPRNSILVGMLSPQIDKNELQAYAAMDITAFSLDKIPRISRAQSMDVLSSQSNLAGYRSVIEAANEYGKAFPMMMTAAGTVPPARVMVLGAGVAGLQAIATAKRLGAIVSAFDVRAAVKEQVESLGATFVEVDHNPNAENTSGYANEVSNDYKKKQEDKIREVLVKSDIVITTALIPGKQAPILITKDMVNAMKPGSVIVDLGIEIAGNCELTQVDQCILYRDIKIIGYSNIVSRIPQDASRLYARNLLNFIQLIIDPQSKKIFIDTDDEIIKATLLTHQGHITNEIFAN